MHQAQTNPAARLYFIDWVRIIAFFVLIFYHVGMYYVSWGWHVKSVAASTAPEPFMMMSSPWRLSLLFMVSGLASSCMLARSGVRQFLRQRTVRLLAPLVFGMLVVVPPQSYLEVVEKVNYAGSYADFMRLYITGYGGFCRDNSCLIMPTWNHLWFVAYIWIYTLALGALVAVLGKRFDTVAERIGRFLTGWRIIVVPACVLAMIRVLLSARFPENHAVVGDWFNHANYFFLFLLGALLARVPAVWARVDELRWPCLGLAATGWTAAVCWLLFPHDLVPPGQMEAWHAFMRTLMAFFAWSAILTACGFAHRHLQRDNAARRYLTEAVFPLYIAHQTVIVVAAHALKPLHVPPGAEALMLVVLAVTVSLGLFEVVRRVPLLRPVFGLAGRPRLSAPSHAPALASSTA